MAVTLKTINYIETGEIGWQDIIDNFETLRAATESGRCATTVVAAADSLHPEQADYVCGGTDDQVEIQAAINALSSSGGEVVCLEGTYYIAGTIAIGNNTTLRFLNGNQIYVPDSHTMTVYTKNTDSYSTLITNADHIGGNEYVKVIGANIDFQGDGKNVNQSWAGIWLDNASNSLIESCRVHDVVYNTNLAVARAFGILFSDCEDSTIYKCNTTHCGYEGIGIRGTNTDIDIIETSSSANKTVSMQVAYWMPTPISGTVDHIRFIRCQCDDILSLHNAVYAGSAYIQNVFISDCEMNGITISELVKNVYVMNNKLNFFVLKDMGEPDVIMSDISIVDNLFVITSVDPRIQLDANASTGNGAIFSNISIIGNTMNASAFSTSSIKLNLGHADDEVHDVFIAGNHLVGKRFLEVTGNAAATVENVHIEGNSWKGLATGGGCIYWGLVENAKVINNHLEDSYRMFSGGVTNADIAHNTFENYTTFMDGAAPTNAKFFRNIGYVTENSGTDTVTAATKAVTHGLAVTPAVGDIMITPVADISPAVRWWISGLTSSQFTINLDQAPTNPAAFAWRAIVL